MGQQPKPSYGTDVTYILNRLREKAPDLHAKVLAGELTPHAAALTAGLRRRRIAVVVDDPESAAKALVKAYGYDGFDRIVEEVQRLKCEERSQG